MFLAVSQQNPGTKVQTRTKEQEQVQGYFLPPYAVDVHVTVDTLVATLMLRGGHHAGNLAGTVHLVAASGSQIGHWFHVVLLVLLVLELGLVLLCITGFDDRKCLKKRFLNKKMFFFSK